jgi:hypothetical protein
MTTPFWKSVEELARMSRQIPEERRDMSGFRIAFLADPPATARSNEVIDPSAPERTPSKG